MRALARACLAAEEAFQRTIKHYDRVDTIDTIDTVDTIDTYVSASLTKP